MTPGDTTGDFSQLVTPAIRHCETGYCFFPFQVKAEFAEKTLDDVLSCDAEIPGDLRWRRNRLRVTAGTLKFGISNAFGSERDDSRLLSVPLLLLPLLIGGARPWLWSAVAALFFVLLAASLLRRTSLDFKGAVSGRCALIVGLLLLYPLLQSAPLPMSVLDVLSPNRALWLKRVQEATGATIGGGALTYMPLVTLASWMWYLFLAIYALILRKNLLQSKDPAWLFRILFLIALFEALYGLLQVLIPNLGVLWVAEGQGVARGTFINRNNYACFLEMLWPLLLARTISLAGHSGSTHSGRYRKKKRHPVLEESAALAEQNSSESEPGSFPVFSFDDEKVAGADSAGLEPARHESGVHPPETLRSSRHSSRSAKHGGLFKPSFLTNREWLAQVRQKQLFLTIIIGLMLLSLFFSQSRGGIIGALTALTVFAIMGGVHRRGVSLFVAGCWAVMLMYGSIIGFGEILSRFDQIGEGALSRFSIWNDAWRLIMDHPLTGVGLDGFPSAIRLYQSHLSDKLAIVHAHNDYLEIAGEMGLPLALLLVLLTWGYWMKTAVWLWRNRPAGNSTQASGSKHDERRLLAIGALAGSSAFLLHGFVEFNWQIPANQLYFITLLTIMSLKNGADASRRAEN